MMKRILASVFGIAVLAVAAAPASAIPLGTYALGSHPAGNKNPPPYGLRLDDLDGSGYWTFDFSDPGSDMKMTVETNKITIFGTTVGGKDVCAASPCVPKYEAGTADLWDISFVYDAGTFVMQLVDGGTFDDTQVFAHHQNMGTVERLSDNVVWDLRDHSKTKTTAGLSFQLGDEDSTHRGFVGISGWGWMDHKLMSATDWNYANPSDGGCCSDWLFTARPIPEPGTLTVFGFGFLALWFMAGWSRRRTAVVRR